MKKQKQTGARFEMADAKIEADWKKVLIDRVSSRMHVKVDARFVEAWMRTEHSTLNGLSRSEFDECARNAVWSAKTATDELNEKLAQSFGL